MLGRHCCCRQLETCFASSPVAIAARRRLAKHKYPSQQLLSLPLPSPPISWWIFHDRRCLQNRPKKGLHLHFLVFGFPVFCTCWTILILYLVSCLNMELMRMTYGRHQPYLTPRHSVTPPPLGLVTPRRSPLRPVCHSSKSHNLFSMASNKL